MLIGFVGKTGVGKTHAATYLKNKYDFVEISFADPIKEIALILGFTRNEVYGTQEEKLKINDSWKISGRTFLQHFGTNIMRDILPTCIPEMENVWINLLKFRVKKLKMLFDKNDLKIIISDCRFLDEANVIKELGGHLVRISREFESREVESRFQRHISEKEQEIISVDYEIDNTNSPERFENNLDTIYMELNAKE